MKNDPAMAWLTLVWLVLLSFLISFHDDWSRDWRSLTVLAVLAAACLFHVIKVIRAHDEEVRVRDAEDARRRADASKEPISERSDSP